MKSLLDSLELSEETKLKIIALNDQQTEMARALAEEHNKLYDDLASALRKPKYQEMVSKCHR